MTGPAAATAPVAEMAGQAWSLAVTYRASAIALIDDRRVPELRQVGSGVGRGGGRVAETR